MVNTLGMPKQNNFETMKLFLLLLSFYFLNKFIFPLFIPFTWTTKSNLLLYLVGHSWVLKKKIYSLLSNNDDSINRRNMISVSTNYMFLSYSYKIELLARKDDTVVKLLTTQWRQHGLIIIKKI